MKKFILGALLLGGAFMTSCQKDWVCECQNYGNVDSYVIYNKTKSKAKKQCRGDVQVGLVSLGGDTNCDVK